MGDLSTHRKIYKSVARPILISQLGLTGEQAQYFELGNWLRDVSQFRDPYSFQLKKLEILAQVRQKTSNKRVIELWRGLLTNTFGPISESDTQPPLISGELGEWFRNMLLALGLVTFCVRTPDSQLSDALGPISTRDVIPESEFIRLFQQFFTQYYPHEHLDFPPTGDPKILGDWSAQSSRRQGGEGPQRRVLAYLDDYIDYIATQMLQAELTLRDLLAQRPKSSSTATWNTALHDALAKLGRASHAIEDYYFHSNFVELAYLITFPGAENGDLHSFFRIEGVGRLSQVEKRKMFRRTRAPDLTVKDNVSMLDPNKSEFARTIFTGMFGGDDTLYTFADAIEGLRPFATSLFVNSLGSTLFKYLLDNSARKELVTHVNGKTLRNDNRIDEVTQTYMHNDLFQLPRKAEQYRAVLRLGPSFTDAITKATEIDVAQFVMLATLGPIGSIPYQLFCIGKVLLMLGANIEVAAQQNQSLAAAMDQNPQDSFYLSSYNGNTAENIGCHTLMAKDSIREQPLREVAAQFAQLAVRVALNTLCKQAMLLGKQRECVDWQDFLRRLLCHPEQAPGDWVRRQLKTPGAVPSPSTFRPRLQSRANAEAVLSDGLKQTDAIAKVYEDLYSKALAIWTNE